MSSLTGWHWREAIVATQGLDVKRIIGEVARRHRILLREDDPSLAVVTISQITLEEVAADLAAEIRRAMHEFEQAATRVEAQAGATLAREVRESSAAVRQELQKDIEAASIRARELVAAVDRAHSRAATVRYAAMGLTCGVFLFVVGVLVGRMWPE